jgi:hypothetical protein
MPKISEFFGIQIVMQTREHGVAHFHAWYQGQSVSVGIRPFTILAGRIHPRAQALVMEWVSLHEAELLAAWEAAQSGREIQKIEGL